MAFHLEEFLMTDYCTVAQVENFLNLDISDDADNTASCEQAIEWATEDIKNYCQQNIAFVEDDEITLDIPAGRSQILLPELPVASVTSVIEDDIELTAEDDYKLGQHGILYRVNRNWKSGVQIVTINLFPRICNHPNGYRGDCRAVSQPGLSGRIKG